MRPRMIIAYFHRICRKIIPYAYGKNVSRNSEKLVNRIFRMSQGPISPNIKCPCGKLRPLAWFDFTSLTYKKKVIFFTSYYCFCEVLLASSGCQLLDLDLSSVHSSRVFTVPFAMYHVTRNL